MAKKTASKSKPRVALTTDRVLAKAVDLADQHGIDALSMRKLGLALGVEAMSLYNHVANKDEILDGIVDRVVGEIEIPTNETDWKMAMRQRAISAHEVFLRHPWVTTLIESRIKMSPVRVRYFDATIGALRAGGFPIGLAYHAFLTLDSYIYGFTLHEVSWQFEPEERQDVAADLGSQVSPEEYPHIAEMMHFILSPDNARDQAGYVSEFEFGLNLILDGLEERLKAQ
tara:strand:- start:1108 stop:1791 length:684 start_codon:yes stop_codon:yes gene_type:complete